MPNKARETILGIRFSVQERQLIEKAARGVHLELRASSWIRRLVLDALAQTESRKAG